MKKIMLLAVILLAVAVAVSACKGGCKKGQEGEVTEAVEVTEEVTIESNSVINSLAGPLCKRMTECAKDMMTEEECVQQITVSLAEAMKEKPIDVAQTKIDGCVKTIKECTCEEIMGTEPPKGCEFLK